MTVRIRAHAYETYITNILTKHDMYPKVSEPTLLKKDSEQELNPNEKPKKRKKEKVKVLTAIEKNKVQQEVPTAESPELIYSNNYRVETLKTFMKMYKLKQCGSKQELQNRLYGYLVLSPRLYKLQAYVRGLTIRNGLALHGPAVLKRNKCNNITDFVTLDDISLIPIKRFFSFADEDGFVYGYDILSLYSLMKRNDTCGQIKNPYNRKPLNVTTVNQYYKLLHYHKKRNELPNDIGYIPEQIYIPPPNPRRDELLIRLNETRHEEPELRINRIVEQFNRDLYPLLDLERIISNLVPREQMSLLEELQDIWMFRSELTERIHQELNPLGGSMFPSRRQLEHLVNRNSSILSIMLTTLEKIIWGAMDTEWSHLSEYFIIGALTLASAEARELVPWMYEAVRYDNNEVDGW